MLIYLWIVVAIVAAGAVAYFVNGTVRAWMQAVWRRWFKDSEVNFAADLAIVASLGAELVSDPAIAQLFESAGLSPTALLAIGVVIRVLRMSRDRAMVPLSKDK